jgi:hypothetical protein
MENLENNTRHYSNSQLAYLISQNGQKRRREEKQRLYLKEIDKLMENLYEVRTEEIEKHKLPTTKGTMCSNLFYNTIKKRINQLKRMGIGTKYYEVKLEKAWKGELVA